MFLPFLTLTIYAILTVPAAPAAQKPDADKSEPIGVTLHAPVGKPITLLIAADPKPDQASESESFLAAAELLPKNMAQVDTNWLSGPIADLPQQKAAELLETAAPAIRKAEKMAGTGVASGSEPPAMSELGSIRQLSKLVVLKTRLEMARGQFDQAARTLGVNYTLARSLGDPGTKMIHGLVGVAIGEFTTDQVLVLIQQPKAPPVLTALEQLPRPLVDVERQLKAEVESAEKDPQLADPAVRAAAISNMRSSHQRALQIARRLQARIAAVSALESIREQAASSNSLPAAFKPRTPASQPATKIKIEYKRLTPTTSDLKLTPAPGDPALLYKITWSARDK